MGVEDSAGFVNIDVSDEIESQMRLTVPFLCSFIKEGLSDDGVFFNEIINSPEKVRSLLSGDKRKHFNYFKQGLGVASLDEDFYWNQPDKHQSDGHEVPDVLNGAG